MRLFARLAAAYQQAMPADLGWRPLRTGGIPLSGPDADMGDDGQVFQGTAHLVAFGSFRPDGATIEVCTYASYADDGWYRTGVRYRYASEANPGWSYTGWCPGPWGDRHPEAFMADIEARQLADFLASASTDAAAWLPQVFGWDGEVFATGTEAPR